MVAAGAAEEVTAARTRRARRPRPARRSASRSCWRATSRRMKRRTRNYAKRQLTWMRKLPSVQPDRRDRARPARGGRRESRVSRLRRARGSTVSVGGSWSALLRARGIAAPPPRRARPVARRSPDLAVSAPLPAIAAACGQSADPRGPPPHADLLGHRRACLVGLDLSALGADRRPARASARDLVGGLAGLPEQLARLSADLLERVPDRGRGDVEISSSAIAWLTSSTYAVDGARSYPRSASAMSTSRAVWSCSSRREPATVVHRAAPSRCSGLAGSHSPWR